jgi:hypothetical protein
VTRAQDSQSGEVEIRSDIPLKEIREGDEGETIIPETDCSVNIGLVYRSLLETEFKR